MLACCRSGGRLPVAVSLASGATPGAAQRDAAWCHSFALSEPTDDAALAAAVSLSGLETDPPVSADSAGTAPDVVSLSLQTSPAADAGDASRPPQARHPPKQHAAVPRASPRDSERSNIAAVKALGKTAADFVDRLGGQLPVDAGGAGCGGGAPVGASPLPKVGRIAVQSLGSGLQAAGLFQPQYGEPADPAAATAAGAGEATADIAAEHTVGQQTSAAAQAECSAAKCEAPQQKETKPKPSTRSAFRGRGGSSGMAPSPVHGEADAAAAAGQVGSAGRAAPQSPAQPTAEEAQADEAARAILQAAFKLKAEARGSRCAIMVTVPAGAAPAPAPAPAVPFTAAPP